MGEPSEVNRGTTWLLILLSEVELRVKFLTFINQIYIEILTKTDICMLTDVCCQLWQQIVN